MTSSSPHVNWRQLGLELVIVVVGILAALGIDSWWAARGDERLERAFLEQLSVDLRQAESQISQQIPGTEQAAQAVLNVLAVARGDLVASSDSIASWVTLAGWWGDPLAPSSTAQALASSANLFVVEDPALRSGIVQLLDRLRYLEARVQPMEDRVFDNYTIVNRTIDPIGRGQALYVGVTAGGLDTFAEAPPGGPSADLSWEPLLRHPDFRAKFTDLFWAHENLRYLQQSMIDAIVALREQTDLVAAH